jgi:hypothetical protein
MFMIAYSIEKVSPHVCVGHGWNLRVIDFFEGCYFGFHIGTLEPDEGAFVAHLITIVRGREDGDTLSALLPFEALLLHLVGAH